MEKKIFMIASSREFYKYRGDGFSTKKPWVVLRIDNKRNRIIPNKLTYTINEGKDFIKNKKGKYKGTLKIKKWMEEK